MTLTPDLETYAANMRQRRRVAAHNLRAARRLQRQGDQEAARRVEKTVTQSAGTATCTPIQTAALIC